MSPSLLERYQALVAERRIEPDPAQAELVARLDALASRLAGYKPGRRASAFARLLGAHREEPPRGLYIHGEVGRGKTLLMDLFFEGAPVEHKRRVHFHAFMADVHARVHRWREMRKRGEVSGEDPIGPVAMDLAGEAWLLCFDELSVRDIADAMILARLFTALFAAGVVVVATSNVAPGDLYKDGLNRALFLPFLALLSEKVDVVELHSRTDYRLEKLSRAPVYYCPAGDKARAALDATFLSLTGAARGEPIDIELLGRKLRVPQAIDGVARFSFDDLCRQPLGSADYLALADRFHTIVVDDIPRIGSENRNEARRFITFIDALYDAKVKLIASAAAEPADLYSGASGAEAFEFARAASRLVEMRSVDYLAEPHGGARGGRSGDLGGLVET
ncbi:MAG TPA: cell division protein ZapE [Roseiarcus sp.]|jgi:cell division protein ZapE